MPAKVHTGRGRLKSRPNLRQCFPSILERKKPDTVSHAEALLYQGLIYAKMENYGEALPVMEEAVEIFENLEAEKEKTDAMANLGNGSGKCSRV